MAASKPPFQVKSVYEYSSPHDDDLSFPNGQLITVTDEEDADWYYGEYLDAEGGKQEGLFPRNFVKICEPGTPARPSRPTRQKKESEPSPVVKQDELFEPTQPLASPSEPTSADIQREDIKHDSRPPAQESRGGQAAKLAEHRPQGPASTKETDAPPAANDKPAGGSFRDRINAFNKPAAPPVAPKPGVPGSSGGTGFIKKPFVAPPPSKNAYVPPPRETVSQKIYRHDEDQEVTGQSSNTKPAENLTTSPNLVSAGDDQDQPKPTSLKDRIALLQKQQMEQAARHAERAQKSDKPKRPPKKRMESHERTTDLADEDEGHDLNKVTSVGTDELHGHDQGDNGSVPEETMDSKLSRTVAPPLIGSPLTAAARGFQSDANDADQSGAGDTEEGEETSTGRDDSDEKPQDIVPPGTQKAPQNPPKEPDVGDEQDDADEEEDEEEEDVDPEIRRRMEIRERMAKMSGGMGMAGMFGPPGGMPGMAPKKQMSVSSEQKIASGESEAQTSRAPPVPIMPVPGMHKTAKAQNLEQDTSQLEVDKEESELPSSIVQGRAPNDMPDVEDIDEMPSVPQRRSLERPAPPPVPQDPPVPVPPSGQARAVPSPLPTERPVPALPPNSRPVPPPPPSQPMSPSPGSESDDEMPSIDREFSIRSSEAGISETFNDQRSQTTSSTRPAPSLPDRTRQAPMVETDNQSRHSNVSTAETSPTSPKHLKTSAQRSSRVPPIPGSSPALPPPTPPVVAPSRTSTGEHRAMPAVPQPRPRQDSDEEVTEYEGDYDTDMAPDADHKDALGAHVRPASAEGDSTNDEETLQHSGLPSLGRAPRAIPPPPPNQPPKANRQSSDMPRAPPPPPPPPKETPAASYDEEYDPYNYSSPQRVQSLGASGRAYDPDPTTPKVDDPDGLYSVSPPRRSMQNTSSEQHQQYPSPPSQPPQPPQPAPNRGPPRQSLDVQRTSSNVRRSVDAPRVSGEHGFIASDVDLGQSSQWWRHVNIPPPVFQNRRDIIYEIEESSTTRRGGRQSITKIVYVLFMDYSQTVVTAVFDAQNPAEVALEQHHEQPPARMRQDQLEDAHSRFGARMAEEASTKNNTIVGDGSPHTLVSGLLSSLPEALPPVGVRAYGALVYANLANASVQQLDEIRPGDIVTFRNAKFQGHRGPMHSKYNIEIGKPDHVGVVVDWDGTKKKVRAWEQGRESKKVKMESFKLGDMRSGEVKVWRVMSRKWVGWEGQS